MGALISHLEELLDPITKEEIQSPSGISEHTPERNNGTPFISSWDPRSPTTGIPRTPIVEKNTDEISTNAAPSHMILDPRSPNTCITRTPIITECDVHRTWDFNQTEPDSMYVNSPTLPICDLDITSSCLQSSDPSSDNKGSLENLLINDSSLLDTESAQSDGAKDEMNDSACVISAADSIPRVVLSIHEDEDPNLSPIGSPVKSGSGNAKLSDLTSNSADNHNIILSNRLVSSSPLSSTPNKPASTRKARPLALRDSNSPLTIVQRKQVAKINKQFTSNALGQLSQSVHDKENFSS